MTDPRDTIFAYLDGALTERQVQALDAWVREDTARAEEFVRLAKTSWRVREHLKQEQRALTEEVSDEEFSDLLARLDADDDHPAELVDITEQLKQEKAERRARRAEQARLRVGHGHARGADFTIPRPVAYSGIAAVAALILIAVILFVPFGRTPDRPGGAAPGGLAIDPAPGGPPTPVLAQWIDQYQARWDEALRPGADGFVAGRYRLTGGAVRLRLVDGTRAKLTAPVEFELSGGNEISLTTGRLVAEVPPQAIGFRVRTPAGDVVDLGTTFGVEVLDAATTDVQVVQGRVKVAARAGDSGLAPFVELTKDKAVRLDKTTAHVKTIRASADRFTMDFVRVIDLVDAVAGGDGTTGMRDAGFAPGDGRRHDKDSREQVWMQTSDGRFHPVPGCPLIAGTFIPTAQAGVVIDPAGNTFDGFTAAGEITVGLVRAGGRVPYMSGESLDAVVDGIDYSGPGRGIVRMHSNMGVCFDLQAMRQRNPGMSLGRFVAGFSNREAKLMKDQTTGETVADLWVFVDGELRFSKRGVATRTGMVEIDLPLGPSDKYLTVVVTEGPDMERYDWAMLCEPRILLRPSDRP